MTRSLVMKILMFWLHIASLYRLMSLIGYKSLSIPHCFCSDWTFFDSCDWQISILTVILTWNSTAWRTGMAAHLGWDGGCLQIFNTIFMMTECQYTLHVLLCWMTWIQQKFWTLVIFKNNYSPPLGLSCYTFLLFPVASYTNLHWFPLQQSSVLC